MDFPDAELTGELIRCDSMACPSHEIVACIERERLMREFVATASEYHRIQSAQIAAMLRDGAEDFPFEKELAQATMRRENAKYAILLHRQKHRC